MRPELFVHTPEHIYPGEIMASHPTGVGVTFLGMKAPASIAEPRHRHHPQQHRDLRANWVKCHL